MTKPLALNYGATVFYQGKPYVISQESHDFTTVVIRDADSGKLSQVAIVDLASGHEEPPVPQHDLAVVPEKDWQEAMRIYGIIQPLLDLPNRTIDDVAARAEVCKVHYASIYRWIRQYEKDGRISVFLRRRRVDAGKILLSEPVEQIIKDVLDSKYLTNQKLSPAKISREIDKLCKRAQLKPPHPNTIRNRIKRLDSYKTTKAREGAKAAEAEHLLLRGKFPGAEQPLAVVQVDHTPVDSILVDDIHRLPIGRPWLTLLIDVYTRMILGYYISFDPPGNLSLGLALTHAILPKESWLINLGIDAKWPCWGLPRTIHADNAKEFRGNMLKIACQEYGVNIEWRPVAKPRYGAHIERLLGTLNEEIHSLPGTTFSNTTERGKYDSDGEATMSLKEFERWFTHLCVNVYHQRPHSSLGMSPIAKWQQGILGTKKQPGIGLPERISDDIKLKLDLIPFETRTVQHYGIVWDHIEYQHDVLRRWVNEPDPDQPKIKRKFLCRRDPRDISVIWFYDPEIRQYFAIPYRNTSHPAISIWELRAAERRVLEEQPTVPVDENRIFAAYDRMQEIEEQAKKVTKKTRRNNERKRVGVAKAGAHVPRQPVAVEDRLPPLPPPRRDLKPYDDADDLQDV
ncbi:Mu transposase C-terminal domain-containing protein [Azonexus sp.]|uniref:Mu transposase C-terminal domain-containing protein n=1 Tax=Azonexus sp. TaxID=1872668 RepID=UPI0027B9A670|nr:Mu transposase C-terminal domain-containing protein [Azonexus sp.]